MDGKPNYKIADEVYGDNLFLMVHCTFPACDWWGEAKIPTSDDINRKSLSGRPTLTWNERTTILSLRKEGRSYREISRITGFSTSTLETYILPKEKMIAARNELQELLRQHLKNHKQARE